MKHRLLLERKSVSKSKNKQNAKFLTSDVVLATAGARVAPRDTYVSPAIVKIIFYFLLFWSQNKNKKFKYLDLEGYCMQLTLTYPFYKLHCVRPHLLRACPRGKTVLKATSAWTVIPKYKTLLLCGILLRLCLNNENLVFHVSYN